MIHNFPEEMAQLEIMFSFFILMLILCPFVRRLVMFRIISEVQNEINGAEISGFLSFSLGRRIGRRLCPLDLPPARPVVPSLSVCRSHDGRGAGTPVLCFRYVDSRVVVPGVAVMVGVAASVWNKDVGGSPSSQRSLCRNRRTVGFRCSRILRYGELWCSEQSAGSASAGLWSLDLCRFFSSTVNW